MPRTKAPHQKARNIRKRAFIEFSLVGRRFQISLLALILATIVAGLLVSLSIWQVHRAQQKTSLITEFARSSAISPPVFSPNRHYKNYQQVVLRGFYVNKNSFLLDNKFYKHKLGYHVITPLKLEGSDTLVLINRGWIPMGRNRKVLPTLKNVTPRQTVIGKVYQPRKSILVLKSIQENPNAWPRVIERFDAQHISKMLGAAVYPYMIWLDSTAPNGFKRAWQPVVLSPQRHIAYAVQWFALLVTFILGFLAFNSRPIMDDKSHSNDGVK